MNKAFEKILERLSNIHRVVKTDEDAEWNRAIYKSTEIVQEVAEEFTTDTNVGSKGNNVLEFANLLKELCCKKDEDYDNPVISPKYLNDIIENLLLDYNEQNNNGWIPCSEKLPELRKDVLVTVKYTGFMGMHGYWIKTGHMEAENDWWGDCAGGEVIAWQPLPKPFQKGDNNENS